MGTINQDGLINAIFNNNPDTGILEGQGFANGNTYDAWDISGPTKLADPGDGSTYLYENIKPNENGIQASCCNWNSSDGYEIFKKMVLVQRYNRYRIYIML